MLFSVIDTAFSTDEHVNLFRGTLVKYSVAAAGH